MAVNLAVPTDKVEVPDSLGDKISDQAVVKAIRDPGPEGVHLEKNTLLAKLIELWVTV